MGKGGLGVNRVLYVSLSTKVTPILFSLPKHLTPVFTYLIRCPFPNHLLLNPNHRHLADVHFQSFCVACSLLLSIWSFMEKEIEGSIVNKHFDVKLDHVTPAICLLKAVLAKLEWLRVKTATCDWLLVEVL